MHTAFKIKKSRKDFAESILKNIESLISNTKIWEEQETIQIDDVKFYRLLSNRISKRIIFYILDV